MTSVNLWPGKGASLRDFAACRSLQVSRCRHCSKIRAVAAPEKQEVRTSLRRNENIGKLQAGYLFPEIAKRRRAHQEKFPDAHVISLGIGDTTEPITGFVADAMKQAADGLGTRQGYSGYGSEQGNPKLREAICNRFYASLGRQPQEIFVSDGSKCDIGRMQMMFGSGAKVAVQDPSYPAYVDSSVMIGQTGGYSETGYDGIEYMVCRPENDFFPDLSQVRPADLIFFCSPNNPTGAAATREQLQQLVDFASANGSVVIYDAAYSLYISDANCPKSIFEIPGAETCCVETCSFSKYAGFTGVRLGWTVVPEQLRYADGQQVIKDWNRVTNTIFNGASNIAQAGGLACLEPQGMKEMQQTIDFYKENAGILYSTFEELGFKVHGGKNAPYIWIAIPGKPSWDTFADILERTHIVTTPGSGFGPAGEGFVRASAFGHRDDIMEAVRRFKEAYGKSS
ncbi:hypothetical protein WJX74_007207 [Apatococcus lobatus]|uniref:Aminotransferase class I/classII large domain-containing protein n=1 Tax=Apatococcus lobatus TaxID=904363 RepID=A0AAW1RJC9_9CHLO